MNELQFGWPHSALTATETTVSPGFRLGLEGQQITGTAWFDDLKLEKVEE